MALPVDVLGHRERAPSPVLDESLEIAAQGGALDQHHVGDIGQTLGRLEGLSPSQDVREVEGLDPDSAGEPVGESAS